MQRGVRPADTAREALVDGVLVDDLEEVLEGLDSLLGHVRDRGGTRALRRGLVAGVIELVVIAQDLVHAREDVVRGRGAQEALEVRVGVCLLLPVSLGALLVELHVDGVDRRIDSLERLVHLIELVHHVVDGVLLAVLREIHDKGAEKTDDREARGRVVEEAGAEDRHEVDGVVDAEARRHGAAQDRLHPRVRFGVA